MKVSVSKSEKLKFGIETYLIWLIDWLFHIVKKSLEDAYPSAHHIMLSIDFTFCDDWNSCLCFKIIRILII